MPNVTIHLCDHVSDLPTLSIIPGPIETLIFGTDLIRQHLLHFGIDDLSWQQFGRGIVDTVVQIAHHYHLGEIFGLTVVVSGGAAALYYLYRRQRRLPVTFHSNDVEANRSRIQSPVSDLDSSHQCSATPTRDGDDQSLASPSVDGEDESQAGPADLTAVIVDGRRYQDHAKETSKELTTVSKKLTTVSNKGSTKANKGADRGRPSTRQRETAKKKDGVEGRVVKKGQAGRKGAGQCRPKVTRAMTRLHYLSP